jgi:hypothetical protein
VRIFYVRHGSILTGVAVSERKTPVRMLWSWPDKDTVLEEAMDNLKEAGQRSRATQSLIGSQGMIDDADYRELVSRLSTSLAMVEAGYMEVRRRG